MNYLRILSITNCYFFLTGYQIRWYDSKSLHYRLTIWGVLHFLILFVLYLICFGHHFEKSGMLKTLSDISPFLKNLVRIQVLVGFKVFIVCIIEWRSLTKVFNNLVDILRDSFEREKSLDRYEFIAYITFFSTLLAATIFGLYIAVELKFELPPLDHIMIGTALFIPHLTVAGCLRLYCLGLWLIKHEFEYLQNTINNDKIENKSLKSEPNIVIEIINPVLNRNSNATGLTSSIYQQTLKRLEFIAVNFKIFDSKLQKQLCLLIGLNFNALLFAVYSQWYFENTWYVIFTDRNRRIFYAANSAIFVCILMDYFILLFMQINFNKTKQKFSDLIALELLGNKSHMKALSETFMEIKYVLSEKLNLKLFGLVEFNTWNFLILQGLMISIVAIIVTYQYLIDQIMALTFRLDNEVSDSD